MQNLKETIYTEFRFRYDNEPIIIESPGRINLIGEHTDYNNGFVLPAAINKKIIMGLAPNNTTYGRFYAVDMKEDFKIDINSVLSKTSTQWSNYILGAIEQLKKEDFDIKGFDCVFGGDIPIGAGLSSSAALEGAIIFGLSQLFELTISPLDMALLGQKVENDFVGIRCGIMDQFVNIFGEADKAILLDCRSLDYSYVPLESNGYDFVLCDTQIRRELASSEYNLRKQQCDEGVELLKQVYPNVESLRDADLEMLKTFENKMDETIYRRCRYIIEENKRVLNTVEKLEKRDYKQLGELMYASHQGLRHKYEVSCQELDLLVDATRQFDGVLGARMMGGGFGGCTINLIEANNRDEFMEYIAEVFQQEFDEELDIYSVKVSSGTKVSTKKNKVTN